MSRIAFISTMYGATWGGSEQLWGMAASSLMKRGHKIAAGVNDWPGPHREWDALRAGGCDLQIREYVPRLPGRIINRFLTTGWKIDARNAAYGWLHRFRPDLVVVCQAWSDDGLNVMEICQQNGWKYASIVQAASEFHWPDDGCVPRLRCAYIAASAAFFVSKHNLHLTERQISARIPRGEIAWNPFRVDHHQPLPWPDERNGIKLACVGRLQPDAKGQDILLRILCRDCWRQRPVELTFFGDGVNRQQLEDLANMLDVRNIRFGGFVSDIRDIWKAHHALVLPSRKEGMPIVLLEASLCGRPAICNQVAGISEIVDDGVTGFLSKAPEVELYSEALERAWDRREEWQQIGLQAAAKVRELVPEKPAEKFAERLEQLAAER